MKARIAIRGAGVMGRTLALWLRHCGFRAELYDLDHAENSASFAAAGMLSPYCERETCEPVVSELGLRSLELWPTLLSFIDEKIFYSQKGSLVVAHQGDEDELLRLYRRVKEHAVVLEGHELKACESELDSRFHRALFFPQEGQIDAQSYLRKIPFQTKALEESEFDFVVDCRGLAGRDRVSDLRGVRGEILWLKSDEVKLSRPIRLMHPRFPIYIVPRPDNMFIVGATLLETESRKQITLRSASELLSSAFSVHSGFAEAEIVQTIAQLRPAFPDNLPRIIYDGKNISVNGLYRHGYLLAPALSEQIGQYLSKATL